MATYYFTVIPFTLAIGVAALYVDYLMINSRRGRATCIMVKSKASVARFVTNKIFIL